jgi:hypothetical protein
MGGAGLTNRFLTKCHKYSDGKNEWSELTLTHADIVRLSGSNVGGDSTVGIATRYGLEWFGDRIPVDGEIFRTRPDRPWGPPSLLYNGYQVSFPGVKRPGRGVDHPPYLEPRLQKGKGKGKVLPRTDHEGPEGE